jgi:hypothetical protein
MNISESNATSIDTISTLSVNNTSKVQSDNMTVLTSLGDAFSGFFTGAQDVNNTLNQINSQKIDSTQDSVNLMQKNLFSSLGLDFSPEGSGQSTLESLTSQLSIESMQATILSALQTSLFSTQPAKTIAMDSANTSSNMATDESTGNTGINTLAQFAFGENGFDLNDGFDIFNVLQHIPIVSAIYQDTTGGEDISAVSKLAGGYLFGGPIGIAFSALDLVLESFSGNSINDSLVNFDYGNIFDDVDNESVDNKPQATGQQQDEYFSLAGQMAAKALK